MVRHLRDSGKRSRSTQDEHPLLRRMKARMRRVVKDATDIVIPAPGETVTVIIVTGESRRRLVLR